MIIIMSQILISPLLISNPSPVPRLISNSLDFIPNQNPSSDPSSEPIVTCYNPSLIPTTSQKLSPSINQNLSPTFYPRSKPTVPLVPTIILSVLSTIISNPHLMIGMTLHILIIRISLRLLLSLSKIYLMIKLSILISNSVK